MIPKKTAMKSARLAAALLAASLAASAAAPLTATAQLAPAAPENWVYVGMKGGAMGWETTTMQRNSTTGSIYILRFISYLQPQTQAGASYSVILQDFEFQCTDGSFRLGAGEYMNSGGATVGASDPEEAFNPVAPGSPEAVLMAVACEAAVVNGAKATATFEDAVRDAISLAIP